MQLPLLLACLLVSARASNSTKDASEELEVNDQNKSNSTKEILKASESGDPAKAEIVKQIRRLNEDGSYTIGYEADDGTFKIESRDVLGNVKGTFGYVDRDGEIKRVTYSSSSEGTPVPVTSTSTTPLPPPMIIRMNKTVSSSTTRRPLGTVVYPTRGSGTTRGTVIQSIAPRRRNITRTTTTETTTERERPEATTSNILNLYKPKMDDIVMKRKNDKHDDDLITKQSSVDRSAKTPPTVKPVYEHSTEKEPENKPNTFRRELPGTSNHHMLHLQQSAGDDSTDVYGGHLSMGTVRPLFTTTTPRPRLVPFNSILAARQRLQQQYPDIQQEEQETTIEASTGRVFDHENVVTSNPVPVVYNPPNNQQDDRIYQQPIYRRPTAIHFRTNEYLRDNPGSAIPIGNQRPFLHYENQPQVLEPQYVRQTSPPPQAKENVPEAATVSPYDGRQQVTRIIPIAVDERGVPLAGYQGRFVNPYRPATQQPAPPVLFQPRYVEPAYDDMNSISTPVSTRDLKRLLQILIIRQNRLQALMDQIVTPPGPPYHPLPMIRQQQYEYQPRPSQQQARYQPAQYQDDPRYDYRYEQQQERQQQQDYYNNQVYDPQYESQRFVPRRRLYTRPVYDNSGASSNQIEDTPEYLPPDVREALLLKMLMLAISPDFMPSPPPATEMTTAAPRKQVRNIQILGEEGSMMHDMKRPVHRN
ncbi:uncharacterized protein LOC105382195 [Plutella xylostella]|uniref:uncharacterized protein LOC105382195 n=1 Tax=Plutella xylostella TaxID=51655 RepID=UPI0020326F6D|nr:uncharacterized protein LOC105382195 [Plutella xylostella]